MIELSKGLFNLPVFDRAVHGHDGIRRIRDEKRMNHMPRYKKTGIFIAIVAVLAIAAILVVFLTHRSPGEETGEGSPVTEKTWLWGQQELKAELSEDTSVPAMSLVGRSVLPLSAETEEGEYGRSIYCIGKHSYFLVRPLYKDNETLYELHVFDGDSKEWNRGILDKELLGEDGKLYGMFAISDQEWCIWWLFSMPICSIRHITRCIRTGPERN